MNLKFLLYVLILTSISYDLSADSSHPSLLSCSQKYDVTKYFYKINSCNSNGVVISIHEYFVEGDRLSNSTFLDIYSRRIKRISYSNAGDFNIRVYEYTDNSFIETLFDKNSKSIIKTKVERLSSNSMKITDWNYEDGKIIWIDKFNPPNEKQIISREFIKENMKYIFKYKSESHYGDEVSSFSIHNSLGELIGTYRYEFDGDIYSVLKDQFSGDVLSKRLEQYENKEREIIAVIDSGYDLYHPSITPFLVNNPLERWGDVDFDANGLAGDVFGWSDNSLTGKSGNINETVIIGGFKPFPLSHGTHVASIALKERPLFSLYGFAGDVGNHKYLDTASKLISDKKIKLVNLSWGFKEQGYPQTPPIQTYNSLKKLISSNKEALFFIAAGNNGWDLEGNLKDYPASYTYSNTLVIGALNVADYKWQDSTNLIPAIFKNNLGSNIGRISVDIFSPGKEVFGAKLGGGLIPMSGTSMASPFAMNSAMIARRELPHLTSLQLKEIVMKSAGNPLKPLPCVSEGFVHPHRIKKVAKVLKLRPDLSIESAILAVLGSDSFLYPGERTISAHERKRIWKNIDLSLVE